MSSPSKPVFAFGPFRLEVDQQRLLRGGEPVPLTVKAYELLVCLVEHHGHLITKDELLATVWPDTSVEEAVLSVNISAVRKALGDDRNGHSYIETVPRRGYRFIAPVSQIETAEPHSASGRNGAVAEPEPGSGSALSGSHRRWLTWVGAATLIVLALLMIQAGRKRFDARVIGNSVAVLPLQSLSDDADQAHFADAMTDLLLTDLGRVPQLRVVSRQSVMQYRKTQKTVPEIARELRVDCIVEGTVRREGRRVRITAQLIHGPTDRHLWAQSYERDLGDSFALQEQVAESIAREIGIKLAPQGKPREQVHVSAAGYEAFLRGMYLLDEGAEDKAIAEFRKTIESDPNYAPAYAKMAGAYFGRAFFGAVPPSEAWPAMKEAALQAIEKDNSEAEAHASLAIEKLQYEWDWPGAEREFRRSLELNPSDSDVRHMYAHYLLTVGRWKESLEEMDRAFETDPVGLGAAT